MTIKETKNKLKDLGFTSAHVQLLTVAFLVLGALIVFKSGINVTAMFAHADNAKPNLTYEQALAQVQAQQAQDDSNISSAESDQSQIALLDRGNIDGQVLGEAIGIGAIPDADQLPLPEITSQISMQTTSQDDDAARLAYQTAVSQTETDANIVGLLGELNSSDKPTLEHAVKGWGWVIDTLQNIPVPPSLAEFHKDKITYYIVMQNIGKIYAGQKPESDLQLLTKAMLSYSQKVDSLQTSLNDKYKLSL